MNVHTERRLLPGPAGDIEVAIDRPDGPPQGLALVAHPHPLFGGALENKVAQTLASAFVDLGYVAVRPNFRGVGKSAGVHDEGRAEVDDLLCVIEIFQKEENLPELVLGGFSFGGFVQTHVAERLAALGRPARRLALVGLGVTRWDARPVPADTVLIHGEQDETVPLAALFDWARPQELPVIVIPGADHFFHRRLTIIKRLVKAAWRGAEDSEPAPG